MNLSKAITLTPENASNVLHKVKGFFKHNPYCSDRNFYPKGKLEESVIGHIDFNDIIDNLHVTQSHKSYMKEPKVYIDKRIGLIITNAHEDSLPTEISFGKKIRITTTRIYHRGVMPFYADNSPFNAEIKPCTLNEVNEYVLKQIQEDKNYDELYREEYDSENS